MKRKSLLIMLLMAFFAPLAMNGQNRSTLTVYDQNTTTNQYVPIYGYYADSKSMCEFIIPKEKISAMNGGVISAMKFYLDHSGGSYYDEISANFNVFVKEVSATTLSGLLGQSGATTVFNSTITIETDASNVEINIPFSSNYVYGGGNLLIGFYQTETTGYNYTYWTGEAQDTNTAWGGYNGSTSAKKFLPKTTFTYEIPTTPTITLPATATVLTGFTETLTATTLNVTGTPSINYTSSNTSVATVSGSGTTATVTGVSAGTATITATMTYNGNTYTAQCAITVEDPSYCKPSFSNTSDYIKSFTTNGGEHNISNTNTSQGTGGYSDFYNSHYVSAEPGTTISFSVVRGYSDTYQYGLWVDWNKDYVFDNSTEKMASTSSAGDWSSSFTIPANTAAGDYHMRVLQLYGSSNTLAPCVSASYGEGEDYKLTVLSTGAYTITCATTTGGTISADKNNADENDVITITATPETDYLLTALTYTPEGGSAQNIDITNMPYTFTMPAANVMVNATFSLPACPRPTNLTVSNLAASHATVSWDSEASDFTVKYSTATVTGSTLDPVFEDGFENGLSSWTTYANGFSGEGTTNWQTFDASQFDDQTNHGGSYSAMSRSWTSSTGDVSVDNWLVSPQMTLGNTLKFWVTTNSGYPDSYAVYVSTGSGVVPSSGTGDFVVVANLTPATGSWVEQTYDLSAYAGQQGYVAIRHKDSSKDHLLVDDFGVYNTINTYSYGGWTTVSPNPTTNSCQITGLSAETLYEVQVQANCGGTDGSSAWSSIVFTTPDNCGAPQELASSDITATTATLSWADDKDSYNLQYRKVYFHEGFEGETMPTGWTTVDSNNDGLCWQIGSATAHSGVSGVCNTSFVYDSDFSLSTTPDDYLISPQLDLQGTLRVWLSGFPRSSSNYSEHFEILLSTNGTSVSDFTTTLVTESTTTNSYVEYTADLSNYTGKGYIAIHHFNCTNQNYLYVDDFGLYGSENWVTLNPNPTTETADLTGLTPNTGYEWQVQGVNCDGNGGTTDWSAVATFSTLEIPAVPVTSIEASDINVIVGETATITPTVLPADATNPAVTYTSADETIVTVNDGVVTGVAAGTTTITIAATDGSNVTTTINVTVSNIDVTGITATPAEITMITGETATISYEVAPSTATIQTVTFTSANTAIATVDADGVVTGVSAGTTTITIASVSNPEIIATVNVTVTSNPDAVQFTVVVPATAQPGDVITVEAYMAAPTSGNYDGFTSLGVHLYYDNTVFEHTADPTYGAVGNACMLKQFSYPSDGVVRVAFVQPAGSPTTVTGLLFTMEFTVLTEVELGSYTFYVEPMDAANFTCNYNNGEPATQIPYEFTPSTVEIAVPETYTKHIIGYEDTANGGNGGNYYLIASPIGNVAPTEVTNMTSGSYDLFYFDHARDLEWVNYKEQDGSSNPNFNLVSGKGYLYANSQSVDLVFVGTAHSTEDVEIVLDRTETADGYTIDMPGWNLVGNPYAEDHAYIDIVSLERPFYTMNGEGTGFDPVTSGSIEPMEGIFVVAEEDGETMTFTTTEPADKGRGIALNLSDGHNDIDRAIVRFNKGRTLPKLQLFKNSTKVYIPQDGQDYAVVRSEEMGEMPVNFKAENNGTYSLSLSCDNVEFAYLHLIDNLTGADIDLLQTPSYSFEAKTTDYESRFKLVFATGNSNGDTFAFFSNGSFVINNEGNATLQVIDVTGRILKSESINGCTNVNVNATPGVYMLRLINGDNVKVQKVVVK